MRCLLLSLCFTVLSTSASLLYAQTGSVQGTVYTFDSIPAAFVNVVVRNTDRGSTTDEQGFFEINNVTTGTHTLLVSHVGLQGVAQSITVTAGDTTLVPNIILKANQAELQEVVVQGIRGDDYVATLPSASLRLPGPLIETPQNIQVVTREVLEDQQVLDMLETVTRNVSGAQMIEHWGTFARVNMRGFKIPAFRNGFNVELPWGPLTEDMAIVDRIEFVKGPAGFMLSSGEPGGLYNVVTKKPQVNQANEVSLTVGSFNTLRSTLDVGGNIGAGNRLLYRLNLMGSTRGSHRDYEFNNRYTIAPSLRYQFNAQTSVTAEYIYQYSQLSLIGAAYVFSANALGELPRDFTLAEPNIDPSQVSEHNVFVDFTHRLHPDWELTAKIAYQRYEQIGSSLWTAGVEPNGDIIRTLGSFDAFNESKLGQLYLTGRLSTGGVLHEILAGLDLGHKDYYADWWQSGVIGGSLPFNIYNPQYGVPADSLPVFDRSRSIRQRATSGSYPALVGQRYASLYVQDQLSFFDNRARLTLGGRYTSFRGWNYGSATDDDVFSPRVGLNVTVAENTTVYGLYDQSFIPQAGATEEGEAFIPVRAYNLEAGVKRGWADGRWNATLSAFQITKENLVVGNPDPEVLAVNPYAQIQLGQAVSQGVEFDVQGELVTGLQLILNYAHTNVEITEDTNEENIGNRIPGHARHTANGWLEYRFQRNRLSGLGVSLGAQYQADRASWAVGDNNESLLPDYFRLDGAVSYQHNDFRVGLNVYNLLNDYLYSGSTYPGYYYWQTEPGTNFRVNVAYQF